ncbi:DEAD/DEAH box helicase [Actinomycetaceae bacterium L2_0104]
MDEIHAQMPQFSAPVKHWFAEAFDEPTRVQVEAWQAISQGESALVIAPTGSGKTLAAFLWAIDRLAARPERGAAAPSEKRSSDRSQSVPAARTENPSTLPAKSSAGAKKTTRVLYVSPLKALGVDIHKNLQVPLAGIQAAYQDRGSPVPEISVGVRSGDTTTAQRRRLLSHPPDILITTPESLYLMLTSAAAETLSEVESVIVDEVHALAGNKRGAHLAVSLERLDELLDEPAQRIGLSATVRPVDEVARFLGGRRAVRVIQPPAAKRLETVVEVPFKDMANPVPENVALGVAQGWQDDSPDDHRLNSTWPAIEHSIYRRVMGARSTIVFANSRRLAERMTAALNDIHGDESSNDAEIARSHHGSVSKEQRLQVETELKEGTLRCVVATGTLELGIDMGAVDQIIQIDAPPSVASGLQRIGRAGHQVGEVSTAIFYPAHRNSLVETAAVTERIRARAIEATAIVRNPLDILAQQTVAAVARRPMAVDEWFEIVRHSAPFHTLTRAAYESVLDMLSGKYPSSDFSELRPRIVWDREKGILTARPGARQLAILSGGTIPDRGLYRVEIASADPVSSPGDDGASSNGLPVPGTKSGPLPRIGELDEEMVYESRVGEIFVLGTTSWRIREITADRVRVVPAPGRQGKMPFWHGDRASRPAELGLAIGAFVGELDRAVHLSDTSKETDRLRANGLDANAVTNLFSYLALQREATGVVPNDREFVVERVKDEVGDWQVLLESPLGMSVHEPWALAVGARLRERYGTNCQISASNDGIIIRFPDIEGEPPGADVFLFDPADLVEIVQREVTGSALFAARFRECAARALLLGGHRPGKRAPLWQQRHRAARLLEVAGNYTDFPIVAEASRECLHDVYDLPTLVEVCRSLGSGKMRLHQITTPRPSPFALSMLLSSVGEFLYQGDLPLGERRLAALSLDLDLMEQLLGPGTLGEVLDADAAMEIESQLQHRAQGWQRAGAEGIVDLLRELGPLTEKEIAQRLEGTRPGPESFFDDGADATWFSAVRHELVESGRVFRFDAVDHSYLAQAEDAGTLAAIGLNVPKKLAEQFPSRAHPLRDLIARYLRTHAVSSVEIMARRFAVEPARLEDLLHGLAEDGTVKHGDFGLSDDPGRTWADARVLERIRQRSAQLVRKAIQPVAPADFVQFLLSWQYCDRQLIDTEGLLTAIEQLCAVPLVASTLETLVLPQRVANFDPELLDSLIAGGEVCWVGEGRVGESEGRISLHLRESIAVTLRAPQEDQPWSEEQQWILTRLEHGAALFGADLLAEARQAFPDLTASDFANLMWGLAWGGWVTSDSLAAMRAAVSGRSSAQKTQRSRPRSQRLRRSSFASMRQLAASATDPRIAGRWSLVPREEAGATERLSASLSLLLDRYGIVSRGSVMAEGFPGGFAAVYEGLSQFESLGHCRRGHFVDGVPGAQFATSSAVDQLREIARARGKAMQEERENEPDERAECAVVVLSAVDPANPFGVALPWPEVLVPEGPKPRRNAGALVAIRDGHAVFYLERGGKTALTFSEEMQPAQAKPRPNETAPTPSESTTDPSPDGRQERRTIAEAIIDTCRRGHIDDFVLEFIDGERVSRSPWAEALRQAGFSMTPRGLSYSRPPL